VGANGKPPTFFEAMVLSDLDFIKLSNHPDYSRKEPVLDGVPPELTPPLHKNGEPGAVSFRRAWMRRIGRC
jgi:hypothetical protein